MGETISYSSGKVPGPDVRLLVEKARAWAALVDAKPTEEWIRGYVLDGIHYAESLCDALEEREREVERLRELLSNISEVVQRELAARERGERDGR